MRRLPASFVFTVLTALPLAAQQPAAAGATRSNTSKIFLETAVNGSGISVDNFSDGTEIGAGRMFRVGYGFTPKIAALLDVTTATIRGDEGYRYDLGHVDLGLRYHFANAAHAIVPYLEVAASAFFAWENDVVLEDDEGNVEQGTLKISGNGVTLGGGVLYFFTPKWALSTGLRWTTGNFSKVTFRESDVEGLDLKAMTTRLNVGVAWFPMARR